MPDSVAGALDSLLRLPATSEPDLALMRCIDALRLASPFVGSCILRDMLKKEDD